MKKTTEASGSTKDRMVGALLKLMESKSYAEASVTDITSLAGVSRTAYYRNYKSKDEILIRRLLDGEKKLIDGIHGKKAKSLREIVVLVSKFFKENAEVIKAVYDAGLSQTLTDMLGERIRNYFPIAAASREGSYAVRFYVGATLSVFRLWIDSGTIESAEEISDVVCKLINNDGAVDFLVLPESK